MQEIIIDNISLICIFLVAMIFYLAYSLTKAWDEIDILKKEVLLMVKLDQTYEVDHNKEKGLKICTDSDHKN